jgi:predicted dehydrogenase
MAMRKIKAALIGLSGFGKKHLEFLEQCEDVIELKAVCATSYEKNKEVVDALAAKGIAFYSDYTKLLAEAKYIDFVSICTPLSFHKQMAIDAMEAGYDVLVEKPPALTIQDIDEMIQAQKKMGVRCAVFFQHAGSTAFQQAVKLIQTEKYGKLQRIVGKLIWKRNSGYYKRNSWSGKLVEHDAYVLDGTLSNPGAHLLNNCLIGAALVEGGEAKLSRVQAELYHAYDIESDDNCCAQIETEAGLPIHVYATLTYDGEQRACIDFDCERATITWDLANKMIIDDGQTVKTEDFSASEDEWVGVYRNVAETLNDETQFFAPLEQTRSFVLAVNAFHMSSQGVHPIPSSQYDDVVCDNEEFGRRVWKVGEWIEEAAQSGKLYSELGLDWAKPSQSIDVQQLKHFNLYRSNKH